MTEVQRFTDFHFPRQIGLIKKLRYISFIINDITLLVSLFVIFVLAFGIPVFKTLIYQELAVFPFTPVLFIFSGLVLLFGAKHHQIGTHYDAENESLPWWYFCIPLFFAVGVAVLGFIDIANVANIKILSIYHSSTYTGFCFFLLGLALIPPFTQIPHRFHITQFLVFVVSALNMFIVLENMYQFFAPHPLMQLVHISLPEALSFVFFSFGILLRWSNRGFIGNFTLDSTASVFAFRVFIINLISAPTIAFITLFTLQKTNYNLYEVITIVVILITFTSSLLLWINVKLLYGHELEHLLMRESLRAHNVDLTKEEEVLQKRMDQLQLDEQEYKDKLDSQTAWQDVTERLD